MRAISDTRRPLYAPLCSLQHGARVLTTRCQIWNTWNHVSGSIHIVYRSFWQAHPLKKDLTKTRQDLLGISDVQCLCLQIHSWGQSFDNQSPNLEFIAPCTVYTVIAGERTYLNLSSIPQLTPRQIRALSSSAAASESSKTDSNLDEVSLSA